MPRATSTEEIENKLVAGRTRLILDKPFLGALVLRLPLQAASSSWCETTYSDAKNFYYNPQYIDKLAFDPTQFVLAAEALHCALSHFNRRGHRDRSRWQLACDHAVNLILSEEGLIPPPDVVLNSDYRGMTAEEIYPLLDNNEPQDDENEQPQQARESNQARWPEQPARGKPQFETGIEPAQSPPPARRPTDHEAAGSRALPDSKSVPQSPGPAAMPPPPLGEAERDALQQQWQRRLAGAAQQAQQAGKLGEGMARLIDLFLQPTLHWRAVLAGYMNSIARDDYSYSRPSSRRGEPAIYPSLRGAQVNLVVALDVSGSIDAEELDQFMTEVDVLKSQVQACVTMLTCDSRITGDSPWIFEAWETCRLPHEVIGGGGTDFRPVFDWVGSQDRQPDLLLYFTDAEGEFPDIEPDYPTLWLVKGHNQVPWGQRIQLN